MKLLYISLIALVSILLGCSVTEPDYNGYYDTINDQDVKTAIATANQWKDSQSKIKSHATPQELIIEFPDNRVIKKPMPDNMMYIAIAPFVNNTHKCEQHYMSSCQGELNEKVFTITAKDTTGNLLYNGNITSMKNGFFELWLPRNQTIQINIEYGSQKGVETISTKSDSRTCITTIKLI